MSAMRCTVLQTAWNDAPWSLHSVHRDMAALCSFLDECGWPYPPVEYRGVQRWQWEYHLPSGDRIRLRADKETVRGAL